MVFVIIIILVIVIAEVQLTMDERDFKGLPMGELIPCLTDSELDVRDTLLPEFVRETANFRNESVRLKCTFLGFRVSVAPIKQYDSIRTDEVITLEGGKFVAKRTLSEELIHNIEELVERYTIPAEGQRDEGFVDNFVLFMQVHAVHLLANVIHRYVAGGQLVHVFEGISQYRAAKSAVISHCTDSRGASQPTRGAVVFV